MHLFSIFMPQIAAQLVELGFEIIRTEPNKKNPKFLVYKFQDTPEFQLALQKIIGKKWLIKAEAGINYECS